MKKIYVVLKNKDTFVDAFLSEVEAYKECLKKQKENSEENYFVVEVEHIDSNPLRQFTPIETNDCFYGGICTNPNHDCIGCPRFSNWNIYKFYTNTLTI